MGLSVFVICLLFAQSPAAQQPSDLRPPAGKPAQPTDQQSQSNPPGSATQGQPIEDVVSIDRIRRALERQPVLTFVMPDPNVPRYRVEVQGGTFKPVDFLHSFYIPPTPAPVPFGGVDYYELQRLNTPPEFWGSAPFTNKDLLGMAALNGAYSLVGVLIKKGLEAQASAARARVHQEVQQELNDLAEHNARIAAGQADDGSGKTVPGKKPAKKDRKKK